MKSNFAQFYPRFLEQDKSLLKSVVIYKIFIRYNEKKEVGENYKE